MKSIPRRGPGSRLPAIFPRYPFSGSRAYPSCGSRAFRNAALVATE